MDWVCHKEISLILFSKNVNHSSNARAYLKPSYLSVKTKCLVLNIHKITLLFLFFDSSSVDMEILIDF